MKSKTKNTLLLAFFVIVSILKLSDMGWAEEQPIKIDVQDNRINLSAQNISFKDVLIEIQKKVDIDFFIHEEVKDHKITLTVNDLLVENLYTILPKMAIDNSAMVFDENKEKKIYVLPKGKDINSFLKAKTIVKQADFNWKHKAHKVNGKKTILSKKGPNDVPIRYMKREVLIKFHLGVSEDEIKEILKKYNLTRLESDHSLSKIGYEKVMVPKDQDVASVIKKLQTEYKVKSPEPNFVANILTVSDPLYSQQWYVPATSFDKAWKAEKNTKQVKVAVIDTGVDSSHPDLVGKIMNGYDFVNDNNNSTDDNGHGTFVTGIIAANANQIGIKGLADCASIIPVKAFDNDGFGTYEDAAKGIMFAADKGAKIINLSFGGYGYSYLLKDAVDYALEKGCLIVAAGGNDGIEQEMYPAAYPDVIGVSAVNHERNAWKKSNRGKHIDIWAPGVSILSTGLNKNYYIHSGTSASSSMVSALAAFLVSDRKNLSSASIRRIIYQSAYDLGKKGWDKTYGAGAIDVLSSFKKEIIPFHHVAIRSFRIEPVIFDKNKPIYFTTDLVNQGTYEFENIDVKIYELLGDKKNEIIHLSDIVIKDKLKINIPWNKKIEEKSSQFKIEVFIKDYSISPFATKKTQKYIVRKNDKLIILYSVEPPVHQWIAFQAYNILAPNSSLKNEISQFLETNAGSDYYDNDFAPPFSWAGGDLGDNEAADRDKAIIEGAWEEDESPRWKNHFWNPDEGYNAGFNFVLDFDSALKTAVEDRFQNAIESYKKDNLKAAYYWLGRTAHLLMDMTVPAHTHVDAHTELGWDGDDSYEKFTARYYKQVNSKNIFLNPPLNIDNLPLDVPESYQSIGIPDIDDGNNYFQSKLVKLFYNTAQYAQLFDSDDVNGSENHAGEIEKFGGPSSDAKRKTYPGTLHVDDYFDKDSETQVLWRKIGIGNNEFLIENEDYQVHYSSGKIILSQNVYEEANNSSNAFDVSYIKDGISENNNFYQIYENETDIPESGLEKNQEKLQGFAIKAVAGLYRLFWDETHPTGGYSSPVAYSTHGNTLPLKAWAESPAGIDHVVFTAFYDGIWHKLYSDNTKPYEYTWDLSNISEKEIVLGFDIYAKNGAVAESPNGTVKIYHSKTVDDFTPPTKPNTPQDQGFEINSTNLTFTWTPSTDSQSGIKGYRLTLNSYPNWENASTDRYGANIYTEYVGDVNSYTFNVGSPHVGRVIRAAVKAVDKAGNESEWSALSDGIEITGSSKIPPPQNSLVRTSGTDKVYLFKGGRKWWIIDQNIFDRLGYQESEIIVYQPDVLDNYPDGPNIISEDSLIRKEESDAVYLIDEGKRRHLSYDAFIHGNYEWQDVFDVPGESWSSIVDIFPEGEEIGWDDIPPSISIVTPSGGENWLSGEQKTIRWTATDDIEIDHIDLYFTIDGWTISRKIAKGLANDGQYNWTVPETNASEVAIRVEAFDNSGNSGSDYSDHFTITNSVAEPPSTPILYNPGKIATRNQVTLRWQKVVDSNHEDNVEYYEIEYTDNVGFDTSTKINAGDPATGSNIYETLSYVVTGLKDDKTYYFRIRSANEEGSSHWSGSQSMQVDIQDWPYFDQSFQEPADGSTNISKWPTLKWRAHDADGDDLDYYVAIGTDPNDVGQTLRGFSSVHQGQNRFDFSEEYHRPLQPGTTYYWQIWVREKGHSIDYYGEYIKSPVWNFTTEASGSDLAITSVDHVGAISPDSEVTFHVTVKNLGSEQARIRNIQAFYVKNGTENLFLNGRGYMDQELPSGGEEVVEMKLIFEDTIFEHKGMTYDNVLVSGESHIRFHFMNEDDQDVNSNNNSYTHDIFYEDAGAPVVEYFDVREYGSMYEDWSDKYYWARNNPFWARMGENLRIILEATDDVMISKIMAQYRYHAGVVWTTFETKSPGRPSFSNSIDWEIPTDIPPTDDAQVRVLLYDDNGNETIKTSELFPIYSSRLEVSIEPITSVFSVGDELTYKIMVDSDNEIKEVEVDLSGAGTVYHEANENGLIISDQYTWDIPDKNNYASKNCYLEITITDVRGNISSHKSDSFRIDPNTDLPSPFNEAIVLYDDEIDFPEDSLYGDQDIQISFIKLDNQNIVHALVRHEYSYYLDTAEGDAEDTYVSVDNKYYITYAQKTDTVSSKIKICGEEYNVEDFELFQGAPYALLSSSDGREQYFYTYKSEEAFVEPIIIENEEIPKISNISKIQEINNTISFDENERIILLNGYIWELDFFTHLISRYPFSNGSIGQEERITIDNDAGDVESFLIDPTFDGNVIYFIDPWETKLVKLDTKNRKASSYQLPFPLIQEARQRKKITTIEAINGSVFIFSKGSVYTLEGESIVEKAHIAYSFANQVVDFFGEWGEVSYAKTIKTGNSNYLILGRDFHDFSVPSWTKYEILEFNPNNFTFSKKIAQTKLNKTIHKSCDFLPVGDHKVLFAYSTELKILDLKSGDIFQIGKLHFKTDEDLFLVNKNGIFYAMFKNKESYSRYVYSFSIDNIDKYPKQVRSIQFLKFSDGLYATWGYGHVYDGTWNTEQKRVNNHILKRNKLLKLSPHVGVINELADQYIGYGLNIVEDYLSSSYAKIFSLNQNHTIENEIFETDWSSNMEYMSYDSKYIGAFSKYQDGKCLFTLITNNLTTVNFNGNANYNDLASFDDEIIHIGYCKEYEDPCYGKHVITKTNLNSHFQNTSMCFGSHYKSYYDNYNLVDINENKFVALGWKQFLAMADMSGDIVPPEIQFMNSTVQVEEGSTLSLLWEASDNQDKLSKYELYKEVNGQSNLLKTFTDVTVTQYDYSLENYSADTIRFKIIAYDNEDNSDYDTIQFDIVSPVQLTSFSVNKSLAQLGEKLIFSWETQEADSSTVYTIYKKKPPEADWVEYFQVVGNKSIIVPVEGFVGEYQFRIQAENDSRLLSHTVDIQGEIPEFDDSAFSPSNTAYYVPDQKLPMKWALGASLNDEVKYEIYIKTKGESQFKKVAETSENNFGLYQKDTGNEFIWKVILNYKGRSYESGEFKVNFKPLPSPSVSSLKLMDNHTENPSVQLTFETLLDINTYSIMRKSESGQWEELATVDEGSYTDDTVSYGQHYEYAVCSKIDGLQDEPGNTQSVFINSKNMNSITIQNENFARIEGNQITLNFSPVPEDCYEKYEIWIGPGKNLLNFYTVSKERLVTIKGLDYSTTYHVAIYPLDYENKKTVNQPATLIFTTSPEPVPSSPSLLSAKTITSTVVRLAWEDNSENEIGFKIERKSGADGYWRQVYVLPENEKTWNDDGLPSDQIYFYRVRAYNTSGNSIYSNETQVTLKTLAGDISGNGYVGLEDVFMSLQILTGKTPLKTIDLNAGVNENGKIGFEEIAHVLQESAGKELK